MNQPPAPSQLPAKRPDEKPLEFIPYGAQDSIKLTVSIIQNLIAVPTRSGKTCSQRDAMKFMMLCQAQRLNPFAGDAFLVGYDGKDGVASFSLITAHQAFLKRAELHPEYDGMESGIVLMQEDGKLLERETDFHLPDETVVGGWAKVYCKNRKYPTYRRIRMERFNKGFAEWAKDPAGMICKCCEADALRSTFPTLLGGLYMRDEIDLPLSATKDVDLASQSGQFAGLPAQVVPPSAQAPGDDSNAELKPADMGNPTSQLTEEGKAKPTTPKAELASMVLAEGFTFEQFRLWGSQTNNLEDADAIGSFEDVPEAVAKRLLRAKTGLINGLKQIREGESK